MCLLEKKGKLQDDNNANEFDEKMQKRSPKSFETERESRAKKIQRKRKKKEEIDQGELTKYDFHAFNISKHDGFFHLSFTIPLYAFACPF
jgi:hypothetical protein